ncbi:uncharacterized protein N0V89_002360 [Didymosphaeria variabile]|uniref:Uncharacterized protein n=1 Tax=Didymosphaeria variabile TaxID=1932322 RepID=A0A9W8XSI9_9PLEO|nr:uncharacterized protein N0V89_002360 [Didymosphaeria variabile]KAJ4357784.1 hypothetical protein N0V89_002360 [Didymosphaeria variabile]
MPPSSKQTVSAASIFKQHPKVVIKSKATPILHASKVQKPVRAKPGSSSSPRKAGKNGWRRQDELHPLAAAFNDTTRAYRQALRDNTTKKLDDTFSHLLNQLHDFNITTSSSPPRASDPNASPQRITIADKADRTAQKLFMPIGLYEVMVARNDLNGTEYRTKQTVEDGLADFRVRHKNRMGEIRDLEKKWETVVGEVWKVGISCLGEDAMSALLLTQSTSPSPPPAQVERHSLMLADIDSKPVRKKVKFEEPAAKLPRFLSAASRYLVIPVSEQVSKTDVKTLKEKVNEFGTEDIDALAKVKKDGDKWWEKKQAQMIVALQKED